MMGKLGTYIFVNFCFYVAALLVWKNQIAPSEQWNKINNYY